MLSAVVVAVWTTSALAVTGTCTIDRLSVEGDFPFTVGKGAGVEMPVEFDEATGAFSISRDVYAAMFPAICRMGTEDGPPCEGSPGSPCSGVCLGGPDEGCTSTDPDGISDDCPDGADFPTIGGVTAWLAMDPGTVTGTIDGGGNITLPNFAFYFRSGFAPEVRQDLAPTLSTGLGSVERTGSSAVIVGEPLDFTTGQFTVNGLSLLQAAPGAPGALASGIGIRCTLSPIPSQSALPAASALAKVGGKAKLSEPLTEDGGEGDSLALKLKLAPGATPFDLEGGHPVIVSMRPNGAEEDVLLLIIAADSFVPKGKKRKFEHSDDTPMMVLVGRKTADPDLSAALGGKLTLKAGKKATTLAGKLEGFDLAALTGSVEVTVAVGGQTVRASATVDGKGKLR
jgi:hypothetical protein